MMTALSFLGHLMLAVVFGSAAIAKARHFAAFVLYLNRPFKRRAPGVAAAVIAFEGALAFGLISGLAVLRAAQFALTAAGAFLLVATFFIAWRLALSNSTDCGCWGVKRRIDDQEPAWTRSLRPAWYGLRNGTLVLSVWVLFEISTDSSTSVSVSHSSTSVSVSHGLAAFAICPIIIAAGLVASIVVNWHLLKRDEHPLKSILAPSLAPLIALSWYDGSMSEWY